MFEKFKAQMERWRENRRRLRGNESAKVSAENAGVGVMAAGAVAAIVALFVQLFVSSSFGASFAAFWPWVYTLWLGAIGAILFVVGAVIYGAE